MVTKRNYYIERNVKILETYYEMKPGRTHKATIDLVAKRITEKSGDKISSDLVDRIVYAGAYPYAKEARKEYRRRQSQR